MNSLLENKEGMTYAQNKIKNIINFFDDKIEEYIVDNNYDDDLKAWMIPIEAIYFVGDNFKEMTGGEKALKAGGKHNTMNQFENAA